MGDLMEEYASGRSSLWWWRQTVNAIVSKVAGDIRNHKLLAARALAIGWTLQVGWYEIVLWMQPPPYVPITGLYSYWPFLLLSTMTLWPAFTGWILARSYRAQQAAIVLLFVASEAAWFVRYLIVHYGEIQGTPIRNPLKLHIEIGCVVLVSTLIGGFLQKPRYASGRSPYPNSL